METKWGVIKLETNSTTPFEKFPQYRPFQAEVIQDILASDKKVTLVEAPPGSGKSIIGMSLALEYGKSCYLATTKPLQDQLVADFPQFPVLKGRSNYPCASTPLTESSFPEVTCEDCHLDGQDGEERDFSCKGRCTYQGWKKLCLASQTCILNTAYYLTETNYVGKFLGRNLIIVDESDQLENAIIGFIEVKVSESMLNKLHLEPPQYVTKWESWKTWSEPFCQALSKAITEVNVKLQYRAEDPKLLKQKKQLKSLFSKGIILHELLDDSWIYDTQAGKYGVVHSFKPIWILALAEKFFWSTADRFVLMSGTVGGLSGAREMSRTLGLNSGNCKWDYIAVPNQFPASRRPVHYLPTANLTRKTIEMERPALIPAITKIMEGYPNGKGLIHTVSYGLSRYILDNVDPHGAGSRLRSHAGGLERTEALIQFKLSTDPLVLVSPSMDRGIDLPYDACRFVVIVKVPYPDLSSKQTNKRLYGSPYGQKWYAWQTAMSIIQMSMRGMRAADDQCDIYILDKNFEMFYNSNRGLFPEWWIEALKMPEQRLEWLT